MMTCLTSKGLQCILDAKDRLIKLPKYKEDRVEFAKYLQYGLMCRFDTRIGPHKYIIVFFFLNIKLKRLGGGD